MDSAADSLLALSNTATSLVAKEDPSPRDEPLSDDDVLSEEVLSDDDLSPLSEVDEEMYAGYEELPEQSGREQPEPIHATDADSEAETERLQVTPENLVKKKIFEISPSKLSQRQDVDMRPEIESLTESAVSSPISSNLDSDDDEPLSDGPDPEEEEALDKIAAQTLASPVKRKRQENGSDAEGGPRPRRRRTGSPASDDGKTDPESEADDIPVQDSRIPTPQPGRGETEQNQELAEAQEEDRKETEKTDTSEDSKGNSRSRPRRKNKDPVVQEPQPEEDEDAEAAEDSEVADENDVDAIAKSEEETARRMQAMESLAALEQHFATLRDRLYDERIAAINHELQLLQESKPAHPELLRQVEVVQKHRDEKFEIEQKLLVYKIGALKNRAVAERSQIHSQYFQTVRDIRERHLERISEHFYRIQRDRFKADSTIPSFNIPFPEKRSQQILQQTAYNKEVSVLSGVAKYVGFPAAPDLAASGQKDVEDDIRKMGISPTQLRPVRPVQRPVPQAQISAPQAEAQFLEQTPWANPQHPIHLSRQNSNRSPISEFLTPATQQRNTADTLQPPGGSASTIVDPVTSASAHVSSAVNTPHDVQNGAAETQNNSSGLQHYRARTASPLDVRAPSALNDIHNKDKDIGGGRDMGSSPLTSRAFLNASAPRPPAITAGTGRFSVR